MRAFKEVLQEQAKVDGIPSIFGYQTAEILRPRIYERVREELGEIEPYAYAQIDLDRGVIIVARCVPARYEELNLFVSILHEYGHHKQLHKKYRGDVTQFVKDYLEDIKGMEDEATDTADELSTRYARRIMSTLKEPKTY